MDPTISVCITALLFKKLYLFVCFVGVLVHTHLKVRGQFVELGSLLLPCVAQVLNFSDQGFWDVPLPTEPSWSSVCIIEFDMLLSSSFC